MESNYFDGNMAGKVQCRFSRPEKTGPAINGSSMFKLKSVRNVLYTHDPTDLLEAVNQFQCIGARRHPTFNP
jgi:hypothetical protein